MNALEIRNLTKSYPGFTLDNLNLMLPSGCIMGLIGENGAGKSTTIKLILDMIHKDSGSITILGKDNGDNIELTKEDIGVVMDERICSGSYFAIAFRRFKSYLADPAKLETPPTVINKEF